MVIGAVPDVLEDVVSVNERCEAHPGRALSPHMSQPGDPAVHIHRHGVTADAAAGDIPFREGGGGVVGAAAAEVGRPRHHFLVLPLLDLEQPLHPLRKVRAAQLPAQEIGQDAGDLVHL